MMDILPAILEKTPEEILKKVSELPAEVGMVHIDVLEDDVWAPIDRDFEVHLMVRAPFAIADKWVDRGAKRLIAHQLSSLVTKWTGVEIGLGVELHVPLEEVYPHLQHVDFVHLMSISEIGAQGRQFEVEIFDRISEVRRKFPNITISVDGGINENNYTRLMEAGANRFAVGSKFKELWQKLQTKEL